MVAQSCRRAGERAVSGQQTASSYDNQEDLGAQLGGSGEVGETCCDETGKHHDGEDEAGYF